MRSAIVISMFAAALAPAASAQKAGDPRRQAAEYERILLRAPDDDAARLAYADVLLRMDDRSGAAREIAKLEPLALTAEQTDTLDALRARLGGAAR